MTRIIAGANSFSVLHPNQFDAHARDNALRPHGLSTSHTRGACALEPAPNHAPEVFFPVLFPFVSRSGGYLPPIVTYPLFAPFAPPLRRRVFCVQNRCVHLLRQPTLAIGPRLLIPSRKQKELLSLEHPTTVFEFVGTIPNFLPAEKPHVS